MTLVKEPIIGKVKFEGTCIASEGIENFSFAIGTDFDEDLDNELTNVLIDKLHQLFHRPKTMYRITSITLSYSDTLKWTLI